MRCLILNCLAALRIVQIERSKHNGSETNENELVKRKIFAEAISMMMSTEYDKNQDQNFIISAFPDDSKMTDKRSWLPMHYAVVLTVENKISEEDVLTLHAANPLAMHSFSRIDDKGNTPMHLLCMQKKPSVSLVRKMCLRDPQAFVLCDHSGKSALHMVAQYSESLEVLQSVLQIDHSLTKKTVNGSFENCKWVIIKTSPLGLLCGRSEFPSFHDMISCLIEVDSTVQVVHNGVLHCMLQYKGSSYQDTSPGSRGDRTVILLGKLLDANADVAKYSNSNVFHAACYSLRGELGIAVLTLLHSKNKEGVKCVNHGCLPVHYAVMNSSLNVIKFLLKVYLESLTMVTRNGNCLLHLALESKSDATVVNAIMEYLCNLCPALIHMKTSQGLTPLHRALWLRGELNIEAVRVLCNTDESVVRDKCTPPLITLSRSQQLPLHLLIKCKPSMKEVSDEGDCFRLFLELYPASAGVKDGHSRSAYDLAVSKGLSVYFIRLLLNADPTIYPVRRRNLNYAARREGIFLAFRALCSLVEPTIWAKLRHEKRDLLKRVISYL
jgi:ankyrin repeat protein